MALLAESITLSIQTACERVAAAGDYSVSPPAGVSSLIESLECLITDRRAVVEAERTGCGVPRAVLERHGRMAVREARLNVRDAPEWWRAGRASAVALAADRGADWLERQGIACDDHGLLG